MGLDGDFFRREVKANEAVCYMDGCWDLLNFQHVETLGEARRVAKQRLKELGFPPDTNVYLTIGVHDDSKCEKHRQITPVMNVHERVLTLLSIKPVDNVVMEAPWIVTEEFMQQWDIKLVL